MEDLLESGARYRAPAYEADEDAAWYHFLHGNVPGHQIDYIYQARVPQGPLSRQHFSHLTRLLRFIEPQSTGQLAFAIGNLSRDDVQHEPGHGGLALMFGLRIHGVVDHAGRQDPPFAHAIATVDRAMDYGAILDTALSFHKRVLDRAADWYRDYVRIKTEEPESVAHAMEKYVARFAELPSPSVSGLSLSWTVGQAQPPKRIVIAHGDDVEFGEIAFTAARIAAVLYQSDIKWTSISNGRERESDEPLKVTVRFLARSAVGPHETVVYDIEDLPEDEVGIAAKLFKATSVEEAEEASAFPRRMSRADPGREVVRRSWEGGAPAPAPAAMAVRRSEPGPAAVNVNVDVDVDEAPEARTLPRSVRPPPAAAPVSVQPLSQRPPPMSEPPEGDRAAFTEMPAIPVAAAVPVEVVGKAESPSPVPAPVVASPPAMASPPATRVSAISAAAPSPVPAPKIAHEPEAEPLVVPEAPGPRSQRTFWVVVVGFILVAGVVIAFLALGASEPARPPLTPPSTATAQPSESAAPSATAEAPPVTVVVPEPAHTDAPAPIPAASETAKPESKKQGKTKPKTPAILGRSSSDVLK